MNELRPGLDEIRSFGVRRPSIPGRYRLKEALDHTVPRVLLKVLAFCLDEVSHRSNHYLGQPVKMGCFKTVIAFFWSPIVGYHLPKSNPNSW